MRRMIAAVTAAVMLATLVTEPARATPAGRQSVSVAADGADLRAQVLMAWQTGGVEVRAAAERALLGTDADLAAFVDTEWALRQSTDERLAISRMIAGGGPAVRAAGQQALGSSDPDAVQRFLSTGWTDADAADQRIRVTQLMAVGGPQVKAAGGQALDDGSPAALDAFIKSGWERPYEADQRTRIAQIVATGGAEVRRLAQRALDAATLDAYEEFLTVGWAIAAARDQETAAVADLAAAAVAAGEEAHHQTIIAKEEAAKAAASAAAARKAAEAAAAAVERARNDAMAAAAAARQAADAAENAAKAAREAISAARAATEAARVAAAAAARAASAAAMTQKAASKAQQAAANAATNANSAAAARDAARAARDVAVGAQKAADAANAAGNVAREAENAARFAGAATGEALAAVAAADEAAARARETGANTAQAIAAANRARANANRATRAANAAAVFAGQAASAAHRARDAALSAVLNARIAADAAEEAAAHAGEAAQAAARATAAANAATAAANQAVTAAQQAREVYDAARAADAERIAVAVAEGREAAQEAVAGLRRYQQKTDADTREASKRSAEVNQLIAVAVDAATPRPQAVSAARKVALALTQSQGAWTREAATTALAGDDDMALAFVRDGMNAAAWQDDRAMAQSLAASGTPAMARAAEAALASSEADVAAFLREQDYPERAVEDRQAVAKVLAAARAAGDTVLAARAQEVLSDGTRAVTRRFLTVEQFEVAAVGDRVRATRLVADPASGPEVKAAAQVALDNTPAALREFLDQGQHTARQADLDAATHEAQVLALLAQANAAATTATRQAQEAQAVAANARGSAAEAAQWAARAQESAQTAATYATQAIQSADRAQESADRAETSARAAAQAAARANAAAQRAARSAAWAQRSFERAAGWANDAFQAANAARTSAIAAGKSADEAIALYNEAYDAAVAAIERQRRQENGLQFAKCQAEYLPGTDQYNNCIHHLTDSDTVKFGKAMLNAEVCHKLASPGSKYHQNCLYDTFNPNFGFNRQLDIMQVYATAMLGFSISMAVVLTVFLVLVACNALCGTVLGMLGGAEVLMGIGGLVDIWLTTQLVNLAAGVTAGTKLMIELKALSGLRLPAIFQKITVGNQAGKALIARFTMNLRRCATPGNSFTPETPVVLGDGSAKPIRDVRIGDRVLAADPRTGATGPRPVTATITGAGDKRLIDVSVDTDGTAGGKTGMVTATDSHPFWVAGPDRWVTAAELRAGQWLRTGSGSWVQITALAARTRRTTVHNLTVAGLHTYHVGAGSTSLLVHNDASPCDVALGYRAHGLARWAEGQGFQHYVGKEWADPLNIEWMGPVLRAIENPAMTLHVRLDGFPGGATPVERFLAQAFAGAGLRTQRYVEGTQLEMAWIARALYRNQRSWQSVKFYEAGAPVTISREPDWWNLVDEPIRVYWGDNPSQDIWLTKEVWRRFLQGA